MRGPRMRQPPATAGQGRPLDGSWALVNDGAVLRVFGQRLQGERRDLPDQVGGLGALHHLHELRHGSGLAYTCGLGRVWTVRGEGGGLSPRLPPDPNVNPNTFPCGQLRGHSSTNCRLQRDHWDVQGITGTWVLGSGMFGMSGPPLVVLLPMCRAVVVWHWMREAVGGTSRTPVQRWAWRGAELGPLVRVLWGADFEVQRW